jgi:steroid delta-isomerase-like uncharacterized protein
MSSTTATPASFTAVPDVAARRATLAQYLDTLNARGDFARFLTDDIDFAVVGGPEARGRDAVEGTIRAIHEQMFDSSIRILSTTCDASRGVAELTFVGTHIAEFAGVPATGRQVDVNYAAVYDFADDGRISALRVYFPMHVLMAQLGAAG